MDTFQEFQNSYVKPSFSDYLRSFFKLPSWQEAHLWAHAHMGGGPLSEGEYKSYLTITDDPVWNKKNADEIQRLRCRTTFGFYLVDWYRWFKRPFCSSYEGFCAVHWENAYNAWDYSREE
jgi:hypothetical protein